MPNGHPILMQPYRQANPNGGKTSTEPNNGETNNTEKQEQKSDPSTHQHQSNNEHSVYDAKEVIQHVMFDVSGNCEMCKERIENAAKSVKGVTTAIWDIQTRKMQIEFDANETSTDTIQKALAKAGHDTERYKADDGTYRKLPDCCMYRK